LDLMKRLVHRRKISVEEYEALHSGKVTIDDQPVLSKPRFVLSKIGQHGTAEEGNREYIFVE
ncbi:MAG: hypothetical protein QXF82_11180, partial [Nitrososphaeria archaeon]